MRGKGINYDTGAQFPRQWTRNNFDSETARRELAVIANELHCTAVRISGSDPTRLAIAAEHAAALGLEVWFSPFPCELTTEQLLGLFEECAARAEDIRQTGTDVRFIAGGELSIFAKGFLPGDDLSERTAAIRESHSAVPPRLNAFLKEAVDVVRGKFGGPVTYASLPFEQVDWTLFDYVASDAYRAAHNAAAFRDEIRALQRHGLPVVITEFGCCTYRGASADGGRGWMIVDRDMWTVNGDYTRDEEEQATYFRELVQIFDEEAVDTAFWFTYAGYNYSQHLDIASYGVINLGPGNTWQPKSVFHAMSTTYSAMEL
ncbi:hypothetical protein OHA18_19960 [Kribbella sp. NBC_00709]|uniref:glycoside hydrolase family 113 n=1 Tax=Kribbella sp. NBC_00709 TaxID=2975972 RepID=UPI002E2C450B|nr:hypothetical protein [Kribbella sp. NBC_00709]